MAADQRIWITGASSGIGRALALRLLAAGHRVAVSARSVSKLASLEAEAEAGGERCLVIPLDVTEDDAASSAVERITARWGGLDVAILNAGTYSPNRERAFRFDDYRKIFDVNFFGVCRALEVLLPLMQAQPAGGHVAVTASLTGYIGLPQGQPYSCTKAALISMCESLRAELKDSNVAVTVINPGFVETPLTDRNDFPMPFLITADEAARVIERGLADRRFEIRFPWQMALSMRLLRLLPYSLYMNLAQRMVRTQ